MTPPLTERQKDAMRLFAARRTIRGTAAALGVTDAAVRDIRRRVLRNLQVDTVAEALELLEARGDLTISRAPPPEPPRPPSTERPLPPWASDYLEAFDRFLRSGMRDDVARGDMSRVLYRRLPEP